MTLNQVIKQVKSEVLDGKFAVVKVLNESEVGQYVYGVLYSNNSIANKIFFSMQKGYAIQTYPEPNDFELVGLELHHPHNNVLRKYGVL